MFFLQVVVILIVAKFVGALLKRAGQPEVIGEMMAGFILGPVVLGYFFPDFHRALFRGAAELQLKVLSDLGILLFMFVVGAEFRFPDRKRHGPRHVVLLIGTCSILVPFVLGAAAAPLLYQALAPHGAPTLGFTLFIATVFSVTAFPVLARILKERRMIDSEQGVISLASAALSDIGVWIMLAIIALSLQIEGRWQDLAWRLLGLVALCVISFAVVRPMLKAWLTRSGPDAPYLLLVLICGALIYASITEWLQVHSVFGAFLFGVCLPRDQRLLDMLVERVEHLSVVVLMPSFFALAGLNTSLEAFSGVGIGLLALVVLVAVAGKLLGAGIGARMAGYPLDQSLRIGVLMNARGLMELVVLKIGMDLGLIDDRLFTLFVIMTVATTMMTGPLLTLLDRHAANRRLAGTP